MPVSRAWRLDLYFKDVRELKERVLPLLQASPTMGLNITNKGKQDDLLLYLRTVKTALPAADVCVHYSLKWQYKNNAAATLAAFREFCQNVVEYESCSVLLVSGGGKKRKVDSSTALETVKNTWPTSVVPICVAFNPFFPDSKAAEQERWQLQRKLKTGLVSGIYLQLGSDLKRLQESLAFLVELGCCSSAEEHCSRSDRKVQVFGSVFVPSKQLLARMRFRPWNGVFLSKDYLSSVAEAEKITAQIVETYERHDVVPLIETAVRSEDDLHAACAVLGF